ncbi:MAG: ATP-binding cassette domain-containing protein, partial [Candidatus Sumerlaeota bacterium]|nr:ATP-binding cassette domain-containing protein [Candidatus Sumerlaeota bacterium]
FGFIYQGYNLLAPFSALENVLIGMRFGRFAADGSRRRRAMDLLRRVGLERRAHARPARLSAGERQRVAIARAVANRPAILLADEPTASLDPPTAQRVLDLILEMCAEERCTLLLVTHDPDLAARLPRRFDARQLIVHRAAEAPLAEAAV